MTPSMDGCRFFLASGRPNNIIKIAICTPGRLLGPYSDFVKIGILSPWLPQWMVVDCFGLRETQ